MKSFLKSFLLLISIACIPALHFAQSIEEMYYRVYFECNSQENHAQIISQIDPESVYKQGSGYVWECGKSEFEKIKKLFSFYEIRIPDLQTHYSETLRADYEKYLSQSADHHQNLHSVRFRLGSMGGYLKLEEIYAHLDSMALAFPNLCTQKFSIGNSNEGRPIYAVKISDRPDADEDEPEVLYTALHHAREPISMMQMIYFMYGILENFITDDSTQCLINERELFFIPVVNPDGYYLNQVSMPQGGGLWRKNTRSNADGTMGVDLNRNYPYQWAYDNNGSSDSPDSQTYRGTSAGSEPEVQSIMQFCQQRRFKNALNYHSFGNLLLFPWGYANQTCPDHQHFERISANYVEENRFITGPSPLILYAANGTSDDWMYGDQKTKEKIFAMTPEVGKSGEGFWPVSSKIISYCESTFSMNFKHALTAGPVFMMDTLIQIHPIAKNQWEIRCTIVNQGLSKGDFMLELHSADPRFPLYSVQESVEGLSEKSIGFLYQPFTNEALEFTIPVDFRLREACNETTLSKDLQFKNPSGLDQSQTQAIGYIQNKQLILENWESWKWLEIYNLEGIRMYESKPEKVIDLKHLPSALYYTRFYPHHGMEQDLIFRLN